MTDVKADGVGSGEMPRARESVLCSLRCTGRIEVWKDFEVVSDARASAVLKLRITMKHGWCHWLR